MTDATQPTAEEMLEWLNLSRASISYYGNGTCCCMTLDGDHYHGRGSRLAIARAMAADGWKP